MSVLAIQAGCAGVLLALGGLDLAHALPTRRRARRRGGWRRVAVLLLSAVGRRASPAAPRGLAARIDAAGIRASASDVMAVKAGAAAAGVPLALLLGGGLPGRLEWALLFAAPAAAFAAPDLWLRARIRRRAAVMQAELPDVLDLLGVAVAAGMSTGRALAEVGRRHPGALAAELRRAHALASLGVPAAEVLTALERRCPAPGMPALVGAVRRADRHGTPLTEALAAQALDARARRAREATDRAARAAPQIQLAVALLLVPSAMLLVAAALAPALLAR